MGRMVTFWLFSLLASLAGFARLQFAIRNSKFEITSPCSMLNQISHPKLRKEVPRLNNSGHPDQDEREANPRRFDFAIAEETEQRVGHKKEPSDWREQNQCEKVVRATVSHEVHIEQRTCNQGGAY